jgi:hypothetical protein
MEAVMTAATTGFRHPYMTEKQAKWLFDLINTRIGNSDPDLLNRWKAVYFSIRTRTGFETAINELRAKPILEGKEPTVAKEPGLYRDPSDGTIYRLTEPTTPHQVNPDVSVYSQKSVARRLLTTGEEIKKGLWRKLKGYEAQQKFYPRLPGPTILAEWRMTDADKVEYVTGICNFCYRGLIDARSVKANCGKDCAEKHGLSWGD